MLRHLKMVDIMGNPLQLQRGNHLVFNINEDNGTVSVEVREKRNSLSVRWRNGTRHEVSAVDCDILEMEVDIESFLSLMMGLFNLEVVKVVKLCREGRLVYRVK